MTKNRSVDWTQPLLPAPKKNMNPSSEVIKDRYLVSTNSTCSHIKTLSTTSSKTSNSSNDQTENRASVLKSDVVAFGRDKREKIQSRSTLIDSHDIFIDKSDSEIVSTVKGVGENVRMQLENMRR